MKAAPFIPSHSPARHPLLPPHRTKWPQVAPPPVPAPAYLCQKEPGSLKYPRPRPPSSAPAVTPPTPNFATSTTTLSPNHATFARHAAATGRAVGRSAASPSAAAVAATSGGTSPLLLSHRRRSPSLQPPPLPPPLPECSEQRHRHSSRRGTTFRTTDSPESNSRLTPPRRAWDWSSGGFNKSNSSPSSEDCPSHPCRRRRWFRDCTLLIKVN